MLNILFETAGKLNKLAYLLTQFSDRTTLE